MIVNQAKNFLTKSPFFWGGSLAAGFYGLIHAGIIPGTLIQRYFASHPVEYITTAMFFVGMAALVVGAGNLIGQFRVLAAWKPGALLGPVSSEGDAAAASGTLLARLERLPENQQDHYLVRRLREALEYVKRRRTADGLDEQLRYLADLDAVRVHESHALFRVIIWAIPILGFLGTVIGITLAIAKLAPDALENSLQQVTAGLGVAFDTTALALGLSIILMFAKFLADRAEGRLLATVDRCTDEELLGRFEQIPTGPEGQLVAVRRMAEAVVQATDALVQRQAEIWQQSIAAAEKRWCRMAEDAGKQLHNALTGALTESLQAHAQQLAAAEQAAAEQNRRHWNRVRQAMEQGGEATAALQKAMTVQAETLHRAVEAVGQVTRLEDTLNRNLATLSGAKHFEQTVMSLAAAINLLNAQLGHPSAGAPHVQLDPKAKSGKAA